MATGDREPQWSDTHGGLRDVRPFSGSDRSPTSSPSYHPIAIVLAALIGAGAMIIGVHAYQEWRARVAIAEVVRAGNEAMRQVQLQAAQQQREEAARQQARQAEIDRQEALKVQAGSVRKSKKTRGERSSPQPIGRNEPGPSFIASLRHATTRRRWSARMVSFERRRRSKTSTRAVNSRTRQ